MNITLKYFDINFFDCMLLKEKYFFFFFEIRREKKKWQIDKYNYKIIRELNWSNLF